MVPPDVKRAQMLLAYQLVVSPDAITGQPGGGGGAAAGTYVSKQQLGDFVQEFAAYPEWRAEQQRLHQLLQSGSDQPLPWLSDILKCWANVSSGSGSKVILRVRS